MRDVAQAGLSIHRLLIFGSVTYTARGCGAATRASEV